jgi:hypothetical protein
MSLAGKLDKADPGPVVATSRYEVHPGLHGEFLTAGRQEAQFLKAQDGFISAQLYRAAGPESSLLFNGHPSRGQSYPHPVRPVAVAGNCIGLYRTAVSYHRAPGARPRRSARERLPDPR